MHKLFIAIHVLGNIDKNLVIENTIKNISIAINEQAAGVFLINNDENVSYKDLVIIGKSMRDFFPTYFIGVNFLDLDVIQTFKILESTEAIFNAVWVDNSHISDKSYFKKIIDSKKKSKWRGLYFAGFDFKYQEPEEDYTVLRNIGEYIDVIVTSGPSTGEKTPIKKLLKIQENIGSPLIPICAASGVSEENITEYAKINGDVYFICASSISFDFYNLDKKKVRKLMEKILI